MKCVVCRRNIKGRVRYWGGTPRCKPCYSFSCKHLRRIKPQRLPMMPQPQPTVQRESHAGPLWIMGAIVVGVIIFFMTKA